MKTILSKTENSTSVIIPRELIEKYNLDGNVEFILMPEGILLRKTKKVREGWEQDAKKIAASEENHREWTNINEGVWSVNCEVD